MGIALFMLWGTFIVVVLWAVAVAFRQLVRDVAKAARRPRFGLVDLFLLLSVLCTGLAAIRWLWDSPSLPIALLAIPTVMPLAWLAKFGLEDACLRREKRRRRLTATIENFELPDVPASKNVVPRVLPRRSSKRKRVATWLPPLTPYSLSSRPLGED